MDKLILLVCGLLILLGGVLLASSILYSPKPSPHTVFDRLALCGVSYDLQDVTSKCSFKR